MRSSASSSATASSPRPQTAVPPDTARPARSGFALTGQSRAIDPRTTAVRPDLADVRLADRVFAPHYAAPLRRTVETDTPLLAGRGPEAEMLAMLGAGEAFDLLDVTGTAGWGIAIATGLVGYVDASALAPTA